MVNVDSGGEKAKSSRGKSLVPQLCSVVVREGTNGQGPSYPGLTLSTSNSLLLESFILTKQMG